MVFDPFLISLFLHGSLKLKVSTFLQNFDQEFENKRHMSKDRLKKDRRVVHRGQRVVQRMTTSENE